MRNETSFHFAYLLSGAHPDDRRDNPCFGGGGFRIKFCKVHFRVAIIHKQNQMRNETSFHFDYFLSGAHPDDRRDNPCFGGGGF